MNGQDKHMGTASVLCVIRHMDKLAAPQLRRVLATVGLPEDYDLAGELARLVEEKSIRQTVAQSGIVYTLTPEGEARLGGMSLSAETEREIEKQAESFRAVFVEEDKYPALYTEQANAIIPLFLSIRKDEKVLFKINIIVNDLDTAIQVKENWMKNAHKAYEAVWECIGEGEPMPKF